MLRWEEVKFPYHPSPMEDFLLFLHFVGIGNFGFITGWFYLSIRICACTVMFTERSA